MKQPLRVWSIYRKELVEILRDRRTLTAMVVIPVVLYPVLMLGFIRVAETEQSWLSAQRFVVQVENADQARRLGEIIETARARREEAESVRATFDIRVGASLPDAADAQVQLFVRIAESQPARPAPPGPPRLLITIVYNEVDARSRTAMEQLGRLTDLYRRECTRRSLEDLIRPEAGPQAAAEFARVMLEPVEVRFVSTATERQRGGWALAQFIPIVLVLMTITGSVYPAIDLTAGERERGTLETLMVTPVPTLYIILGKFLVVATVGILTAVLNVASVGATIHLSGLTRTFAEDMPIQIPLSALPVIVLCMIPFALLFAAILVAVCSFARTFKEAQNYVMPVILGALVPAMVVTLPSFRLTGGLLVLPVGNMVLLARELFQQTCTPFQVLIVLLTTTLYAAAALGVAVRLFGQEAVVFADAGSYRALFHRRYFRPQPCPTRTAALMLAAVLFPLSFYANTGLHALLGQDLTRMLAWLAVLQFAGLFVLVPLAVAAYCKLDLRETFGLRLPPARAWLAALLLGASCWVPAAQVAAWMPANEAMIEAGRRLQQELAARPLWMLILLLAAAPAVGEEWLFRGFVLSGLSAGRGRWAGILATAAIFAVYHFAFERLAVTFGIGLLLACLVRQSGSILPAVLLHALHNGLLLGVVTHAPALARRLGLGDDTTAARLPLHVLVPGMACFLLGLGLLVGLRPRRRAT